MKIFPSLYIFFLSMCLSVVSHAVNRSVTDYSLRLSTSLPCDLMFMCMQKHTRRPWSMQHLSQHI